MLFNTQQARLDAAGSLDWRYKLLFEFLRISPGYWLAHIVANGASVPANAPKDFDTVQRTYSAFGSVWNKKFHDWWFEIAQYQFDLDWDPPLGIVGFLERHEELSTAVFDRIRSGLVELWSVQRDIEGMTSTVVLSVPLHGDRRETIEKVTRALEYLPFTPNEGGPFRLAHSKAREGATTKALDIVRARYTYRDKSMWEIAAIVNLSAQRIMTNTVDDRHVLSSHVSRYTKKAYLLAENAARGHFPDEAKLPNEIADQDFDFALLNTLFEQEKAFFDRVDAGTFHGPINQVPGVRERL